MARTGYPSLPEAMEVTKSSLGKLARACNRLLAGKLNSVLDVTLTAGAASTIIQDDRIGADSHLDFRALTAHAAAISASIYITDRGQGMATVNHTNTAEIDQDFTVSITG